MPQGRCSVDGCDRPRDKREWCNRHYIRWRRHGDPLGGWGLRGIGAMCSIAGCDRPAIARGWCKLHYERWSVHGDPAAAVKVMRWGMPAYDRVMAQSYDDPNGCRIFTGYREPKGYGVVKVDGGRNMGAHRVVLVHHQGLAPGMVAMHACDNPPCVNIAHLSWGTSAENTADAVAKGRMGHRTHP